MNIQATLFLLYQNYLDRFCSELVKRQCVAAVCSELNFIFKYTIQRIVILYPIREPSIMKTYGRTPFKTSIALSTMLVLGACNSTDGDFEDITLTVSQIDANTVEITATDADTIKVSLSAAQEIPAPVGVPSLASGVAEVSVNEEGVVTATLSVSNLTGPATMAHIHRGFAGETGPILVGLVTADGGSTWTVPADAATLTAEEIQAFNNGELYFNVHTEANAPGEIRGQINAAADASEVQTVSVALNAAQEIPAPNDVPSGASGVADVSVDANGVVTATLGVSNLSGVATAAHIHRGFAGSTGPVLVGLVTDDGGSTWTVPSDAATLTADEIGAFNRGELYFNVHTEANAPGEIRGQIDAGNATSFVVRIENISTDRTLNVASTNSTQPVPLSPGAFIVHREANDSPLLLPRDAANAGLEAVAEDGNVAPYPAAVPGAAVFNTPVGADAPGPIGPGAAYEFNIQAVDGDKLSFVTMFIPSNDWFYTSTDADNSLDLFVGGEPVSGEVAATDIAIWDAGTEVDEEPGTGINQVQRQEAPNTGDADPDTRVASLAGRGQSVSLNGRVLRMVITPQP